MDINYLLHREQVERIRAGEAACDRSRAAHAALAEGYRDVREEYRRGLFAPNLQPRPL